jgi:hypothetical protein
MVKIVAVHEAGHAVARVLVAGELGYSLDEVISVIAMGAKVDWYENGQRMTRDQGSTWGPFLSKEMEIASREWHAKYRKRHEGVYKPGTYWPTTMKLCRAAGVEIGKWFRARALQAVSGPIAEAIASKRPFIDIWNGDGWDFSQDRTGLVFDAECVNIGGRKFISTINRAAAISACLMENPEVWAALLAVAEKLPESGWMYGRKAVSIISSKVAEPATLFDKADKRVSELKLKIGPATVISMQSADGSNIPIKGEANGKTNARELQLECVFPVFPETLRRLFGERRSGGAQPARAPAPEVSRKSALLEPSR